MSHSPFLPEYFGPYLGEYVNVLAALEKLNVAILKAMDKTKEVSEDVSVRPPQRLSEASRWRGNGSSSRRGYGSFVA